MRSDIARQKRISAVPVVACLLTFSVAYALLHPAPLNQEGRPNMFGRPSMARSSRGRLPPWAAAMCCGERDIRDFNALATLSGQGNPGQTHTNCSVFARHGSSALCRAAAGLFTLASRKALHCEVELALFCQCATVKFLSKPLELYQAALLPCFSEMLFESRCSWVLYDACCTSHITPTWQSRPR